MGRSRVHPVLLLALVSAASVIIIASIFVNGNLAGENPQNFATAASLPYRTDLHDASRVLVGDATLGAPYFRIEPHWMDNFGERHCEECTMVEYSAGLKGTAGVAYVADKIYDLSEAKKVVVFVMGDKGGEKVSFSFAGKDLPAGTKVPASKTNLISGKIQFPVTTNEITLENDWQRLEIPLDKVNLDKTKYPFAFQVNSGDAPKVRFYVGEVFFDSQPVKTP
jgi:hypothetical protein